MTKLRLTSIAALALGALTIAGAALSALGPERVALSEAQLQERINRELPRQFRSVTVERATVRLVDGRISLRVETRARLRSARCSWRPRSRAACRGTMLNTARSSSTQRMCSLKTSEAAAW